MITKVLSHNLAGFGKVNLYYWKYNSVKICNIMNKNQLTIFFDIIGNTVCTSKEKCLFCEEEAYYHYYYCYYYHYNYYFIFNVFFSHALFFLKNWHNLQFICFLKLLLHVGSACLFDRISVLRILTYGLYLLRGEKKIH